MNDADALKAAFADAEGVFVLYSAELRAIAGLPRNTGDRRRPA
jgi:hypothetical protein